jgi:hypothetical protein
MTPPKFGDSADSLRANRHSMPRANEGNSVREFRQRYNDHWILPSPLQHVRIQESRLDAA